MKVGFLYVGSGFLKEWQSRLMANLSIKRTVNLDNGMTIILAKFHQFDDIEPDDLIPTYKIRMNRKKSYYLNITTENIGVGVDTLSVGLPIRPNQLK